MDQGLQGLTLAVISDWATIFTLIFGGCCSNALSLEQLTRAHPQSGSLITFAQFLLASMHGLPTFLTFSRSRYVPLIPIPKLRKRKIPLTRYVIQVGLFYGISLLNNKAFGFRIPMPVHIIFRSGGLVVSIVMGWLFAGRRYTMTQVMSVLLVTVGVILTTLSASAPKERVSSASLSGGGGSTSQYAIGIAILSLALILSGALGIVQDRTYALYAEYTRSKSTAGATGAVDAAIVNGHARNGEVRAAQPASTVQNGNGAVNGKAAPHHSDAKSRNAAEQDDDIPPWKESVFYLHFLSLPLFSFVRQDLIVQFQSLQASPPLSAASFSGSLPSSFTPVLHPPFGLEKPLSLAYAYGPDLAIPSGYVALALTTLTSVVCVSGVNRLTARVSSLTVTLVLVIRKAVSMVISVVLFGARNGGDVDARMMWAGAALVFLGTMGYAAGSRSKKGKDAGGVTGKVKKD